MSYVLVTVLRGKISETKVYTTASPALKKLLTISKSMNENDDVAVFGPDGLILNARQLNNADEDVFIIANPDHSLGFLVIAHTEPVGYTDPAKALCALQQIRQEMGKQICLYRVEAVEGAIINQSEILKYLKSNDISDFDHSMVVEFINCNC